MMNVIGNMLAIIVFLLNIYFGYRNLGISAAFLSAIIPFLWYLISRYQKILRGFHVEGALFIFQLGIYYLITFIPAVIGYGLGFIFF